MELRHFGEVPWADMPGLTCRDIDYSLRLIVIERTRHLTVERCTWQPDGYGLSTSTRELSPLEMDLVRVAYGELELSRESECAPDAEVITLGLDPPDGPEMLFADEEHSACPATRVGGSSYVSGLNELFAMMKALTTVD
jgi:hypothetical protein